MGAVGGAAAAAAAVVGSAAAAATIAYSGAGGPGNLQLNIKNNLSDHFLVHLVYLSVMST